MTYEHKLEKSRDIPLYDLFNLLQLEYISYYLRKKIYVRPEDKKKFADICKMKKEKIDRISLRNCIPSIFSDEKKKDKYFNKFFQEWGLPKFNYRDAYQEDKKGFWDKLFYFSKGCSVRVRLEDDSIEMGEVLYSNIKTQKATISIEGKSKVFSFDDMSRMFPNDFFKDFDID